MADTKVSALPAAASFLVADEIPVNEAGTSKKVTGTQVRTALGLLSNASTVSVSAAYSSDTYLAGSAITVAAGSWLVGTTYCCEFDMTKTGAGTATPIVIVRMGTLGTTGDAAILTLTLGAGTAVADAGWFVVKAAFRTVGGGTTAVLQGACWLAHNLATTGLTNTPAGVTVATSAGFNSSTQTIIGISFNGGASFSGTNTLVLAEARKV